MTFIPGYYCRHDPADCFRGSRKQHGICEQGDKPLNQNKSFDIDGKLKYEDAAVKSKITITYRDEKTDLFRKILQGKEE